MILVASSGVTNTQHKTIHGKYEISEENFLRIVKSLDLQKDRLYPTLNLIEIEDADDKATWLPGPGKPEEQIASGYLYSKLLTKVAGDDARQGYICLLYKDGFMYIEAWGLQGLLLKEAQKVK